MKKNTLSDEVRPSRRDMNCGMPSGYTLSDEVRPSRRDMSCGMPLGYTFRNAVKGKKWLQYFLAALLVFVITMTGCGVEEGRGGENTGDAAANAALENEADIPAGDQSEGLLDDQGAEPAGNQDKDLTAENAPDSDTGENMDLAEAESAELAEDGTYTSKDDVARYIYIYGHLPSNFITKKEARNLGWEGGSLEPYAPGKCIGGSHFGNYEGLLPEKEGRVYTECDIDTLGADKRGPKRIVFSNDGLIYYTEDHYESFELLYGED